MMVDTVKLALILFTVPLCQSLPPSPATQSQDFFGSMSVEWKDVSYSVMVGKGALSKRKQILHSLSGRADPGHLVAIMGPTGR